MYLPIKVPRMADTYEPQAPEAESLPVHLPGQRLIELWVCIDDRHFRLRSLV